MKQVAIVGTQGVPANYGGFETLVENIIGENCPKDVLYTVFCSSKDMKPDKKTYKGAQLKYIGLHANGIQSIPYDILSMIKAIRGYDVILVLGVSGCMFLPIVKLLSKAKIVVNIDGLEHRRAKWGRTARWVLRQSEAMAVKWADCIVADNKGIQDYVTETYRKNSELIAYGGDHVLRNVTEKKQKEILNRYGLKKGEYAICVCRIEPENNCHITLEAFAQTGKELVFVGNWEKSEYGRDLKEKYGTKYPHIKILPSNYDLDILYTLRSHCGLYIHGHSAGGTNPSLVEAMFFGCPIVAFDVVYNRETTHNQARYFKNVQELTDLLKAAEQEGLAMKEIAEKEYTWKHIAEQYCRLYNK